MPLAQCQRMLAYVFWHWPDQTVTTVAEYEAAQRAFHAALGKSAPGGFTQSATFRLDGEAAWLAGAPAYADWYLVADSASLDPLNVAAVSGICESPHSALARGMAAGAGSLFTLRGDTSPSLDEARHLTFLTKPREMPYADFYAAVSVAPPDSTLWRRSMVLGPTPEFGLLTNLPPQDALRAFHPSHLALTPIYP